MPARKIGNLDRRVVLKRPTYTAGIAGDKVPGTPTTIAAVWAQWVPESGNEAFVDDSRRNRERGVITIRHRAGIQPTDVVEFLGKTWDIKSVSLPDRLHQIDLVVEAKEVASG